MYDYDLVFQEIFTDPAFQETFTDPYFKRFLLTSHFKKYVALEDTFPDPAFQEMSKYTEWLCVWSGAVSDCPASADNPACHC